LCSRLDFLATLLKLTGNETQAAYDGLAAIEASASFRLEVILLDIGLPNLNGYEVCRRIRQQPWGADIVIVALTGGLRGGPPQVKRSGI
jgi:CheY-like chemotaxis protein